VVGTPNHYEMPFLPLEDASSLAPSSLSASPEPLSDPQGLLRHVNVWSGGILGTELEGLRTPHHSILLHWQRLLQERHEQHRLVQNRLLESSLLERALWTMPPQERMAGLVFHQPSMATMRRRAAALAMALRQNLMNNV
jgi:hypothetical protein